MAKFIVDTHTLIWYFAKNPLLGARARSILMDPSSQLILPSVALAECLWILTSRNLGIKPDELLAAVEADLRIDVYPLTGDIVVLAQSLTKISEMHDRQIAATALFLSTKEEQVIVLTKDANIVASGLVSTTW